MKMWKSVYEEPYVVEVECEVPEYPNTDADGDTIFDNTHFKTQGEALEEQKDQAIAGISLDTSAIKRAEENLFNAKERLCQSAVMFDFITKALCNIQREREKEQEQNETSD